MLHGMTDEAAETPPPLPRMDHEGGDKESQYHPRLGDEICRRMCAGQTIREIAADPEMPSYATIFHWRRLHHDFAQMYDACRAGLARKAQLEDAGRRARREMDRAAQVAAGLRRARPKGSGRKSTYDVAVAFEVCRRVAGGEALSRIARAPGAPSLKAIYTWLKRFPEFEALYLIALDEQAFWYEHEIYHRLITSDWRLGAGPVEAVKGRRGRRTPKKYRPQGRERPKVAWVEALLPDLVFGDQSWRWPPGRPFGGMLDD